MTKLEIQRKNNITFHPGKGKERMPEIPWIASTRQYVEIHQGSFHELRYSEASRVAKVKLTEVTSFTVG